MNETQNDQLGKIKIKLRKMMKKEESARQLGNLQEAEAFASKIQQMLIQYELEMSEIDMSDNATENINEENVDCSELTNRHESSWVVYLYNACAGPNFCTILTDGSISGLKVHLIGQPMHREFTHYMVHQLVPRLRILARDSFKSYDGGDKRNTYIRSWLRGAAEGIGKKLREEQQNERHTNIKVDAIVLDKGGKLSKWMSENYPNAGHAKQKTPYSQAGYKSGVEAGRNMNVAKGVGADRGYGGQKMLN